MGAGIAAVIPIVIGGKSNSWGILHEKEKKEYFSENFFENYTFDEEKKIYTIKLELLINNYFSFLVEFYDCIGEEFDVENVPNISTSHEFESAFDAYKRNMSVPYLDNDSYRFSSLGCASELYWVFYSGSYKAYLETYCTLLHFEKTLARALKNPLAHSIKLGIYG